MMTLKHISKALALALAMLAAAFMPSRDAFAVQNASDPPEVLVSVGQRDTISRVVFDRPDSGDYEITKEGNLLRIRLDAPYRLNFGPLLANPLTYLGNPRAAVIDGDTYAEFDVPAASSYSESTSGPLLIIAITPQDGASPIEARQPPPVSVDGVRQQPALDNPDLNNDFIGRAPVRDDDDPLAGVVPLDSLGPSTEQPGETLSGPGLAKQSADVLNLDDDPLGSGPISRQDGNDILRRDRINPERMEIVGVSDVDASKPPVSVNVEAIQDGLSMTFAWPEAAGLAAFERAGYLWLVFDRGYRLDPEGLVLAERLAANRIDRIEYIPHNDALVLRLRAFANQNYVIEQRQLEWIVSLKDTDSRPRFPLQPERVIGDGGVHQVVVRTPTVGRKIEVVDPTIGDQLTVFPLAQEGRGMPREYQFSVVDFPETTQGIVVVPLVDGLDIQRFSDQIAIKSGNKIFAEDGVSERSVDIALSDKLVDFDAWRAGQKSAYRRNLVGLQYRLSVAEEEDLQDRRWDLARFYLAHNRAPEAFGILQTMQEADSRLTDDRSFLMVLALTKYKLDRYNEAWRHLEHRSLSNEQDADLWRAVLAEKRGNPAAALDYYRRGKDVIGSYDTADRLDIQLAVARAAMAEGDFDLAQRELQLTEGLALQENQRQRRDLHVADLLMRVGQENQALGLYDQLVQSDDHAVHAAARLAKTNHQVENGAIDPLSAIEEYETLRYVWRDDGIEIEALDRLTKLYAELGEYSEALMTYKNGLSYLPDEARKRDFFNRQEQLFIDLYLGGKADDLPHIQAISLWFRFSELTPPGERGDRMIRNLTNRLVSVHLYSEAAELLEYQVADRLSGIARANVAANLARIYILDDKPEKALTVIRATREPNLLPEVEASRTRVEARALIDLARYEEAEELLINDLSAQAQRLLADIYWGSQQWDKVIEINQRLLGDGWRRNEDLDDLERLQLMRQVIAMNYIDDSAGLAEARRRYANQMSDGTFAIAFEQLTNEQNATSKELGEIANQIASVERLQTFLRDYKSDFGDNGL